DGMMIIEHSKYTKLDHMINFSFKKSYGGSVFSFFEINSGEDEELRNEAEITEDDEG
ncbi:MAG: 16S rRNA (guanine(966)-N(2))-methyltransferase RsmD, partial [Flavobacterium johnsoniae]